MDNRTLQLIDALQSPGAAFLFELVKRGALTEDELLQVVPDASQATGNRRLHALGKLGLLTRAPGARQYKDRAWAVSTVEAADAFLGTAMELSRAIADMEAADRTVAEAELREARKRRRRLREAESKKTAGG